MKKIRISTKQKEYSVVIEDSGLRYAGKLIDEMNLYKNLFIVVDENVFNLHKEYITDNLSNNSGKIFFYILKAGEESKSVSGLTGIISALNNNNFGRDTLLLAIGGGVAGDLAGFAASIYMRGIQLAHIPTTLLSAVDSAIGGKTGINFNNYKNVLGSFYQPEFVFIDTYFLSTLPAVEINSGAGELVKYAFLTNEDFYNYLFENFNKIYSFERNIINKIIYESVLFKGSVISKDEFESGLRKILNLGHTFAHAYEGYFNYQIKHGEAVSLGIISALFLSLKKGLISEKKLNNFLKLPLKTKLHPDFSITDADPVIQLMYGDKKNRGGEIRFILLKDIGKIVTDVKVSEPDITYALKMTEKVLTGNKLV
jgi:3-dehydroquinate synthase